MHKDGTRNSLSRPHHAAARLPAGTGVNGQLLRLRAVVRDKHNDNRHDHGNGNHDSHGRDHGDGQRSGDGHHDAHGRSGKAAAGLPRLPESQLSGLPTRAPDDSYPRTAAAYREACHEGFADPLRPAVADELGWYFRQLRAVPDAVGVRLRAAQRAFAAPRYRALYRAWQRDGDRVLNATTSPIPADTVARRNRRLDCHVPAHQYLGLSPLVVTA